MVSIKPRDWKSVKYWLHLGIISVVVAGLLQLIYGGDMFTLKIILGSIPILGVADITAHTILQME
jgi:hypothetical protein